MTNAFDGLTSRLDIAEERTFELDDNRNFEKQKAKRKREKQNIPGLWDNYKRCTYNGNIRKKREKKYLKQ